jgi:UDP-sulfoquinovose synthase
MISQKTGVKVDHLPNPRVEADENELNVQNEQFLALGLKPTTLSEGLLEEVREIASKYLDRADKSKIPATSLWRKSNSKK